MEGELSSTSMFVKDSIEVFKRLGLSGDHGDEDEMETDDLCAKIDAELLNVKKRGRESPTSSVGSPLRYIEESIDIFARMGLYDESDIVDDNEREANLVNHRKEIRNLQKLFGQRVVLLERNGFAYIQISVPCHFSQGVHVLAKTPNLVSGFARNGLKVIQIQNLYLYKFDVQHLPPAVVTLHLPAAYPSRHAPYFTIAVDWLDTANISSAVHRLDAIWMWKRGQTVLFQWIKWLESSFFNLLISENTLHLVDSNGHGKYSDMRAIGDHPIETIIAKVIDYNERAEEENFHTNQFKFSQMLCHECGEAIKDQNQFGGGPCKLFPEAEIAANEAEQANPQAELVAEGPVDRRRRRRRRQGIPRLPLDLRLLDAGNDDLY